jgi:hypothetical protein
MIIDTPTQHPFKHTSSLTAISSPEINSSSTSQGIRFPIQDLQTSHYSPPPSNGHSTQHHLNLASLPLSFPKFREARQVAYASRARSKSRPGSPRNMDKQTTPQLRSFRSLLAEEFQALTLLMLIEKLTKTDLD